MFGYAAFGQYQCRQLDLRTMAFVRFAEVRTWLEDDDMMGHVGHALVISHVGRGAMTNIIFHNSIRICPSQPLAGIVFRSVGDLDLLQWPTVRWTLPFMVHLVPLDDFGLQRGTVTPSDVNTTRIFADNSSHLARSC